MSITPQELLVAVRHVAEGDATLSPQLAVLVLESLGGAESLTAIEGEVVLLIAGGWSQQEAATRLGLSIEAIEAYMSSSLRRLL